MTAADYQLDFNGTVIGDGTTWDVVSWGGLEEWTTRQTDVVLPMGWGAVPGPSYVDPRVVIVTIETVDPMAIIVLEAALVPPGLSAADGLVQIRWKFPNREELTAQGRCSRRGRPRTITTALGLTQLTFELEIPDPRCYAAAALSSSLAVFTAGTSGWDATAGAGVDAGWDTTAGAGVDAGWDATAGITGGGLFTATNAGSVDTYPQMYFSTVAGMSAWSVTNQTTGQIFAVTQTLNVGETLVADMVAAVTGNGTLPISISGVSRYGSWTAPRTPLRLIPGPNVLRFDVAAGDQNATCLVSWQSAYL